MNNYSNILLNTTPIDPLIILSKHVVLTNNNINIKQQNRTNRTP